MASLPGRQQRLSGRVARLCLTLAGSFAWGSCTFPSYVLADGAAGMGGAQVGVGGTHGDPSQGGASPGSAGSGAAPPEPTCLDQVANGDETDVDCGGSCTPCSPLACSELVAAQSVETVVGRDALVGWFRFFDDLELGADSSPAANHALSSMKVQQTSDASRGCVGSFGGDAELLLPALVTTHMTLALWLRTKVGGRGVADDPWHLGSALLDAEQPQSVADFGFSLVDTQVAFGVGNPDVTLHSSMSVVDGSWHHVAAARDDATGQMVLYVDGVLDGQLVGPVGPRTAITAIHAGRGRLVADLADVRLYNRVLSAEEVALMQQGK